jgi:hypothetical protein
MSLFKKFFKSVKTESPSIPEDKNANQKKSKLNIRNPK